MKTILCLVLLGGLAITQVAGQQNEDPSRFLKYKSDHYEVGDARFCMELERVAKNKIQRFEVLPGTGWDNLQNIGKGQVIDYTYAKCSTTDDGRYLIPDHVFTIPIKASYVDTFAELIESWHNSRDITAEGINVNSGLTFGPLSISGSFSRANNKIKEKQIEDEAKTVRVNLLYYRYNSQLQPDAPLHKTFKRRLLNIAAFQQLNQTKMARYEAQLVIRDFGTHVLTSITAGAGLVKTDFLKRSYVKSHLADKSKMLAQARIDYALTLTAHLDASKGKVKESEEYQSYKKAMTHSYVTSYGGPIMKAFGMSANNWTAGVDFDLVAMDRLGDPLSYLVTKQTLPELPLGLIDQVEQIIRSEITHYYEMNTYSGCTKMGSPNFSFSANFDDGSCQSKATNMTFGGVFQECYVTGNYLKRNPCSGFRQQNPKTRGYTCPEHYTKVKLVSGWEAGYPEYKKKCESCGFLWLSDCCENIRYQATAHYTTYWCAGLSKVPHHSGYLFAGIYSNTDVNPITGTKGCPPYYYAQKLMDKKMCISDDFEMGMKHSVPFGGLMSCSIGNPLALDVTHTGPKASADSHSLFKFYSEHDKDTSVWPKHCPIGHSAHLATIDNDCAVQYCTKSGSLSGPNLPPIKIPPFHEKPRLVGPKKTHVAFNKKTKKWVTSDEKYNQLLGDNKESWTKLWSDEGAPDGGNDDDEGAPDGGNDNDEGAPDGGNDNDERAPDGGNDNEEDAPDGWIEYIKDLFKFKKPWFAAVIAVVGTLFCGVLALVAFRLVKKRKDTWKQTIAATETDSVA